MNILRILNTVLLVAILAALVLILQQIRQPLIVRQPIRIQGLGEFYDMPADPIKVEIDDTIPVRVEVER